MKKSGSSYGCSRCQAAAALVLVTAAFANVAHSQERSAVSAGRTAFYGESAAMGRRPAVSPYLNLLGQQTNGAASQYHMFVRPMLDQQQMTKQQFLATQRAEQLRGRTARSASKTGNLPAYKTRYLNYSHYFPTLISSAGVEPRAAAR